MVGRTEVFVRIVEGVEVFEEELRAAGEGAHHVVGRDKFDPFHAKLHSHGRVQGHELRGVEGHAAVKAMLFDEAKNVFVLQFEVDGEGFFVVLLMGVEVGQGLEQRHIPLLQRNFVEHHSNQLINRVAPAGPLLDGTHQAV